MLQSGELHLWYATPDEIDDPRLLDAYAALLTDDERARWRRYRFEEHRREYLVTRALCRAVLSRYVPIPPAALTFAIGPDGKPELATSSSPRVRFNLSNTRGMVVCVVGLEHDLGVDVEHTGCRAATLEVAEEFFAPAEVAALRALPPAEQPERFFRCWTLKEAYIKARGEGVRLGLDRFAFSFEPGREAVPVEDRIAVAFVDGFDDRADAWSFRTMLLSPTHRVSLAVRSPSLALVTRKMVPLAPLDAGA